MPRVEQVRAVATPGALHARRVAGHSLGDFLCSPGGGDIEVSDGGRSFTVIRAGYLRATDRVGRLARRPVGVVVRAGYGRRSS